MNSVLEKRLIFSMYMEHLKQQREWFRFNEIAALSGIKKSSLQRVLPRLIKRGWIECQKSWSFNPKEPQGAIVHLMGSAEVQNYKLPLLYLSSDGNNNKRDVQRRRRRKRRQLAKPRPLFPKEIADEYVRRLPSLERKVVSGMESNLTPIYDKQSYCEAEAERLKQSRRKISYKKAIRFRGQADLFEDVREKMMPKEYVFYRVIILPYFQLPVLVRPPSLRLKGFEWNNIPEGTKRFWAKAKQELIEEIRQYEKDNPKIVL
jgi:hypothetical protein